MRSSGFVPELDALGPHPQGAPVGRARRRRLLNLGEVGEAVAQRRQVLDRLALARDDGLQLVEEVALGEELLGEGPVGELAPCP